VKRKAIIAAAGVAVVGALVYVGSLWAQQPAGPAVPSRPAAAPRTKIALLNLTYVISYYEKYKAYKEEMKSMAKPYEERIKAVQLQMEALRAELVSKDKPPTDARKAEIEKAGAKLKFEMDDANNDAKQALAKQAGKQMVLLYQEVQSAARAYAASHDFDLVLQYNEPLEKDAYYGEANVERKMSAGALIPLYYSGNMEISQDVLGMLNASYRPTAGAAAPTGTVTPAAAPGGP
jgi:Skp family chaperone for outer membrane proteins